MIVTADIVGSVITSEADIVESVINADADFVSTLYVTTAEDYTGSYEVTSFTAAPLLTTTLVLPTNDKHMLDDVTVYSVPTSEEYNEYGGVTLTIGG